MKERKAALIQLGATLALIFIFLALGRTYKWLDWIGRAFLVTASVVILWKLIVTRPRPAVLSSWIDALPERWRKKVLGEDE